MNRTARLRFQMLSRSCRASTTRQLRAQAVSEAAVPSEPLPEHPLPLARRLGLPGAPLSARGGKLDRDWT
ncbi:hypothetical protein JQX08_08655 [Pseudomonas sp. UL073]|uniref:Uncharacterized protein n=1 Tax=Zestomonas insulae TaxID=2809017 RepID=A0ABS2IEQ7_9GAMM|nr:hypothetical protein [Pseudomonas insulae]MBM7060779.1 hypothetical protein [Pseudomonas insulae]